MAENKGRRSCPEAISRRAFFGRVVIVGGGAGFLAASVGEASAVAPYPDATSMSVPWWHAYPSFIQTENAEVFAQSLARMDIHGVANDPTWGPYAQHLSEQDSGESYRRIKEQGARVITWIEGFGDCMLYAVALNRRQDGSPEGSQRGSFEARSNDPTLALVKRSHWNWADPKLPTGNTFRWVGQHNLVNREDFVQPLLRRLSIRLPKPTYPDGRSAVGFLPEGRYPLNARIYDACGAKDINGDLHPSFEMPTGVNDWDPVMGRAKGPIEGLYPAIAGKDDVPAAPGVKPGEPIYCGVISVHKDLSAPYWREYVHASVREIVRMGLDGVWCDNYSPWDNFGYPPLQKAFGDWSVYRFHQYVHARFTADSLRLLGVPDPAAFDVRRYLKARATAFGAQDPSKLDDPVWRDVRWLDDPIWNAFKAFRQQAAQQDLWAFYHAIHKAAAEGGRPDFCIGGNDVPLYGLGWVHDDWQDMINTETTPGWHMGSGSRGIMIPPTGKMAVLYRAALEHQKGPFSAAWYYLTDRYEKHQQKPEIGKVLVAEAFANGTFLLCAPENKTVAGTVESHAWWNGFVRDNQAAFGDRVPIADVGVLFSPDNQLALLAPGGFPDMDRQPHIFGHHGWATALIDTHIPYRTLTDWKLTPQNLAPLRALVIPDAECLEDSAIHTLVKWVQAGGRLVVTGTSGTREGPTSHFMRRPASALGASLGIDMSRTEGSTITKAVGKGRVIWTPLPLGMDYYLHALERTRRLPELARMVGTSSIVDAAALPTTVGLFPWRARDNRTLFADLVNYDLDADADLVRPAEQLTFRMRLPAGVTAVQVATLSPDAHESATAEVTNGWATIHLPKLTYFASVQLRRQKAVAEQSGL